MIEKRIIDTEFYTSIELDISNECNLKCPLCHRNNDTKEAYTLHTKEKQEMSLETIKEINDKFPNIKTWYLGFLICEPFLHSEIHNIISFLKGNGKHIVISTNGNLKKHHDRIPDTEHKERTFFWYALRNLLNENDKIIWSFDGLTNDVYKKYRRGGQLKHVLDEFNTAINMCPKTEHCVQTIKFVHNQHQLEDYDNFKKELSKHFKFNIDWDDDVKEPNITWSLIDCCGDCSMNDDTVKPTWNLEAFKETKDLVKKLSDKKKLIGSVQCESNENKIVFVDHEGNIGFCPTHLTRNVMLQKLKKEKPITVHDSLQDINQYIINEYECKSTNPICQFNCGKIWKEKKKDLNLQHIRTQ